MILLSFKNVFNRILPRHLRAKIATIKQWHERRQRLRSARPYLARFSKRERWTDRSVLFITSDIQLAFRSIQYRCYNILDYIRDSGWVGGLVIEEEIPKYEVKICTSPPSLCVLVRLEISFNLANLIDKLKKLGTKIVYDIDDLVFEDAEGEGYSALMRLSDALTGTTRALIEAEKKINDRCYLVPNSLSRIQESIAKRVVAPRAADVVTIGYFSGTATHDADFLVAAEPIYDVLMKYDNVRLAIVGWIKLPSIYASLDAAKLIRYPIQGANDYFRLIGSVDINVIPLVVDRFNNCKSELKLFESAVWSVPSIMSPVQPYVDCIENWRNGVLAYTEEEWRNSLVQLIDDGELRRKIGCVARDTIGEKFSNRKVGELAVRTYQAIVSQ